jgi:hypothetical protein
VAMEERIQWPGKGFEASLCHMKVTADSLQMCKTWWSQEDQQQEVKITKRLKIGRGDRWVKEKGTRPHL